MLLKKITLYSFAEMAAVVMLIYAGFHYYVGTQSGDFLVSRAVNMAVLVGLVAVLVVLWAVKRSLKRRRLEELMEEDDPDFPE